MPPFQICADLVVARLAARLRGSVRCVLVLLSLGGEPFRATRADTSGFCMAEATRIANPAGGSRDARNRGRNNKFLWRCITARRFELSSLRRSTLLGKLLRGVGRLLFVSMLKERLFTHGHSS